MKLVSAFFLHERQSIAEIAMMHSVCVSVMLAGVKNSNYILLFLFCTIFGKLVTQKNGGSTG